MRHGTATLWHAALATLLALAPASGALAQLGNALPGYYTLPAGDFTWLWGAETVEDLHGPADFRSSGFEGGFQCELSANLSPSSQLTQNDIRQMENQLRTSLAFVQEAAYLLADWDFNHRILWGMLECVKQESNESPEAQQKRVDKALERAIRDRERRRARDQD